MLDVAHDLATRPHSISESESNIDAFAAFTETVRDALRDAIVESRNVNAITYANEHAERVADELGKAYREVHGSGSTAVGSADGTYCCAVDSKLRGDVIAYVVNGHAYAVDSEAKRRPDPRTGKID